MFESSSEAVSDFRSATSREWLETNGIGGFASGTICGGTYPLYHGVLVAAMKPPLELGLVKDATGNYTLGFMLLSLFSLACLAINYFSFLKGTQTAQPAASAAI